MIIFKLLGSIILFVLLLMLIFISIGFVILKRKLKFTTKKTNNDFNETKNNYSRQSPIKQHEDKIFDYNEGEYVDFEEIKESK